MSAPTTDKGGQQRGRGEEGKGRQKVKQRRESCERVAQADGSCMHKHTYPCHVQSRSVSRDLEQSIKNQNQIR